MTVTVGFDPRARRRRGLAAALLNLSGLGLGYLYLRLWVRAAWYWIFTAVLVALANALNAADAPGAWLLAYGLWLVLAAYRGWIHGSHGETATIRASALAPLAGVLAIALTVTGLLFCRSLPQAELDKAEEVHAAGRCEAAMRHYERAADTRYEFTLSPALADARAGQEACELLLNAEDSAGGGDFTSAVDHYQNYLRLYGGRPPFAGAEARLIDLRLDEADALAAQAAQTGAWQGAGGYLEAFGAYFSLRADHPESEEAGEVAERVEGMYAATTGALTDGAYCRATDSLRRFARLDGRFGDEPEARDIADRAARVVPEASFGCGEIHTGEGRYCRAVPEYQAVMDAPSATRQLAARAEESLRAALFGCGEQSYEERAYERAREVLERLVDDYPRDGRADDAGELLIAIDIAEVAAGGEAGQLPALGEAGDAGDAAAAGEATVSIENGSSQTLEVLYTGPATGSTAIDACEGCAKTLTLPSGSYEVVARATADAAVVPFYGTWELAAGRGYDNYLYITF